MSGVSEEKKELKVKADRVAFTAISTLIPFSGVSVEKMSMKTSFPSQPQPMEARMTVEARLGRPDCRRTHITNFEDMEGFLLMRCIFFQSS